MLIHMKVALVHDYLNQVGGGERVLDELIKMFPEASVYTLLYDEEKTLKRYTGKVAKTSFLDFQFVRDHHRLFIPFMPLATLSIRIPDDVDLIISDSAGFGKGIRYNREKTKHVSYIHTPLRYAWETHTYFGHSIKARLFTIVFSWAFWFVRRFDYWAAQRPDALIANSHYIADKVRRYYGRDAAVVYPPVSNFWFQKPSTYNLAPETPPDPYYLAAGRLLHYKRFDLIIDAFGQLGLPLRIVGTGPEEDSLRARAKPFENIQFLGFLKDDTELRRLYAGATGFAMANEEDFGLVMAEAQACGTPVIAYGKGGASEIVAPETGVFFDEQTPQGLVVAVEKFESMVFKRDLIRQSAERFSIQRFKGAIVTTLAKT